MRILAISQRSNGDDTGPGSSDRMTPAHFKIALAVGADAFNTYWTLLPVTSTGEYQKVLMQVKGETI